MAAPDTDGVNARTTTQGGRSRGRPRTAAASGDGAVGRDALIDAAIEMLRTFPPAAITPVALAREMGVHPSLIRYYFRNRPGMLVAVAERLTERFASEVEAVAGMSGGKAEARLCARIGALIDLNAAYPFFHQLFAAEIAGSDDPDARAMVTRFTQRGIGAYGTILRGGLADRSFRGMDPGLLYVAVIGMAEFFVSARRQLEIAQGTPIDEEELRAVYKAFVCDLVVNGVRSRG